MLLAWVNGLKNTRGLERDTRSLERSTGVKRVEGLYVKKTKMMNRSKNVGKVTVEGNSVCYLQKEC